MKAKRQGCLVRFLRNLAIVVLVLTALVSAQLVIRKPLGVDPADFAVAVPTVAGSDFVIADPYDQLGPYYKAQLHMHTDKSLDGKWPVEEAVRAYKEAGYTYLAITDHDTVTIYKDLDSSIFITIPGEENTVNYPFWPFGQHMVRLFVDTHARWGKAQSRIDSAVQAGGIVGIAHPNWIGNLGTGVWTLAQLLAIEGYNLFEVNNPYSDSASDTQLWHELICLLGPERPIWAIAVDDAHARNSMFDSAWIMVQTDEISPEALKEALQRGSFYATTGPLVRFAVVGNKITVTVESGLAKRIIFIGADKQALLEANEVDYAEYAPVGNEGFVRIEVINAENKKAWSQPFWLLGSSGA